MWIYPISSPLSYLESLHQSYVREPDWWVTMFNVMSQVQWREKAEREDEEETVRQYNRIDWENLRENSLRFHFAISDLRELKVVS